MTTACQIKPDATASSLVRRGIAKTCLLACAVVVSTAAVSHAATFTGSAEGAWTSVDATFGYATSTSGTSSTVTWGVEWNAYVAEDPADIAKYVGMTAPDSNRLSFSPDASWSSVNGGIFSLGSLAYHNGTSYVSSHDFKGASLSIGVAVTDPLVSGPLMFEYAFSVLTTTNQWVSVPKDADTLLVEQAPVSQYFEVGNQRYLFEILGLSSDGGATFSNQFVAYEAWQNGYLVQVDPTRAAIYARISPAVVPIPATLPLLLSALGAVGLVARRNRKSA